MKPTLSRVGAADVVPLLEHDTLRCLVTLKMINSYARCMSFLLLRTGAEWGLLSLLPTAASDWDRKAYPDATHIAFLNSSSYAALLPLFSSLPKGAVVVKTEDRKIQSHLVDVLGAEMLTSFISFTSSSQGGQGWKSTDQGRTDYEEAAWLYFGNNGYEESELERHFHNGGRWFGLNEAGRLVSVCFIYQNYRDIWEIAGVYTHPDFRRRGHARVVVTAALSYLQREGLRPRYQVKRDNVASIQLAKELGLTEFLDVGHYRINVKP